MHRLLRRAPSVLIGACLVVSSGRDLLAQCAGTESAKLIASDGAAGDWFGGAVSLSNDVALVGAYQADTAAGPAAGAAYVFRFDGTQWVEEQKLIASDGFTADNFGTCVGISGSVAVVGSPTHKVGDRWGAGQAYVYRFDGAQWVEEQKLTASDPQILAAFGCMIAAEANVIAIGAPMYDTASALDAGAVYVFRFDGQKWVEEQRLTASDGAFDDRFGFLGLDGSVLVIGAFRADTAKGLDAGAAYVFRFNGTSWVEEQKLTASDGAAGDSFGARVSVDGGATLVAAPVANSYTGATYVFRFDGTQWVEEQKLVAGDGMPGDSFGGSVAASGDAVISAAPVDDTAAGTGAGSGYVYQFDGIRWLEQTHLFASDAMAGDYLGTAAASSRRRAVLGARNVDTPGGQGAGAAYIFSLTDLALTASQTSVLPGDTLTFTICGGLASAPVGLFVVDVSGTPTFLHVGLSLFDAQGTWTLSGTVPPGLSGLTMDFQAYGFFQPTRVGASGRSSIAFQ